MSRHTIRAAIIGAGPAGQAHAFGWRNATMTDELADVEIELGPVVDPNTELASAVARRYGFAEALADYRAVVGDPRVSAASVALPNHLALPVITELLAAGKHVIAEKPLGRSAQEAEALADAARRAGVVAAVGFSYRRLPALAQLREAVQTGVIGRPLHARADFLSDYGLDPQAPWTWRYNAELSGGGALIDMGTHAIDALEHIVGPISAVTSATLETIITERPGPDGDPRAVTNDDIATVGLRFSEGPAGQVVANRVAAGYPLDLNIEILGAKGRVGFSFARSNEWLLYERGLGAEGTDAPRVVRAGPQSPYYEATMPMVARGNPTGYGEAFIAQIQAFAAAVAAERPSDASFDDAVSTMRVAAAALAAAQSGGPVSLDATSPKAVRP
ncbi:MAG: Gfo/Idh/MocA family oxidoreductase [Bifidobacteriaceae bacterium]|jgi:predicted dehydrogenase|nr:Gfo/Idh/MocA family oxidoreductase [Bifidobacteriaceae bacterium]